MNLKALKTAADLAESIESVGESIKRAHKVMEDLALSDPNAIELRYSPDPKSSLDAVGICITFDRNGDSSIGGSPVYSFKLSNKRAIKFMQGHILDLEYTRDILIKATQESVACIDPK